MPGDVLIDLSGKIFGRLLVIRRAPNDKYDHTSWFCVCSCGKELVMSGNRLKRGNTKSCGCLNRELAAERRKKVNKIVEYAEDNRIGVLLTKNKIAYIDKQDYSLIKDYGWHYAKGYARSRIKNRIVAMHTLIMGTVPDKEIDHIDNNGINNCRSNLRIVTHADNTKNVSKNKNKSTQYIGVSFCKRIKRYVAYIDFSNKRISIGYYNDPVKAALDRDALAVKLSPYYKLNFKRNTV